jgi:hypothetical protein
MDEPELESSMNLVIPFIQVQSVGGIYDDTAFTAGFHCGAINQLILTYHETWVDQEVMTYSNLIDQIDLIAMGYGLSTEVVAEHGDFATILIKKDTNPLL